MKKAPVSERLTDFVFYDRRHMQRLIQIWSAVKRAHRGFLYWVDSAVDANHRKFVVDFGAPLFADKPAAGNHEG